MKAQLYKDGAVVAEIDAPEPAPPKVWAKREAEISHLTLDQADGTVTIHRADALHDVFGLFGVYGGVAKYKYEGTI